jgi:radical SAM superfamily enzyme YgiQ (UPF0313 family)
MDYEGMIYRPPSEAYSLILQVTVGCSHNHCTFCSMYKDKKFHIKPVSQNEEDLKEARRFYGNRVKRIFLADGDALVLEMEKLTEILKLCKTYFPQVERITSYGTAGDVLRKSKAQLTELKSRGLSMIYLGAESGSETVLAQVNKQVATKEMIEAAQRLREAGILSSVTLISGLGGQELLEEHAVESARLITEMKPDYLGFLTLMLEDGTPMKEDVKSGRMKLLTPPQVVEEMELFLKNVDSEGTVFRSNHASNYVMLKGTLNRDIPDMLKSLERVRQEERFRRESMRRL